MENFFIVACIIKNDICFKTSIKQEQCIKLYVLADYAIKYSFPIIKKKNQNIGLKSRSDRTNKNGKERQSLLLIGKHVKRVYPTNVRSPCIISKFSLLILKENLTPRELLQIFKHI